MKLINFLTVDMKYIDKAKQLIELWKDRIPLEDWDFTEKVCHVVEPISGESADIQVWICLAEKPLFDRFAMACASTIDDNVRVINLRDAKKIL